MGGQCFKTRTCQAVSHLGIKHAPRQKGSQIRPQYSASGPGPCMQRYAWQPKWRRWARGFLYSPHYQSNSCSALAYLRWSAKTIQKLLTELPRRLLRLLTGVGSGLLALLILFEEWGWVRLQRVLAHIGRWPGLRWIEGWLRSLPPWGAVAVFALPTALLLPVKLLALWAIGRGHVVLGMLVIVVAKIVGTAVVARLFTLTQPVLMQLRWFAWTYAQWVRLKQAVLARARASWAWRVARVIKRQLSQRWRRWRR